MRKFFKKECIRRAFRTFFQTAAGYIAVNIAATDLSVRSAVIGLTISAVSAGIAAAMNLKENV